MLAGRLAGWLAGCLNTQTKVETFFLAPGKRFPGNLFLGAGSREAPSTEKSPGNFSVEGGSVVPRNVSMALIQPDFAFQPHPGKKSQGFFSAGGRVVGAPPGIQFFSMRLRYWVPDQVRYDGQNCFKN